MNPTRSTLLQVLSTSARGTGSASGGGPKEPADFTPNI